MIYYLAYGSNMAEIRLCKRIFSAEKIGLVTLSGYRLTFGNASTKDGSAKCDALFTGKPDNEVIAVLYRMPAAEKSLLDAYEGLGVEYRDVFIPIQLPNGQPAEALIYLATNLNPDLRPYHWYKEHVLRGAEENGLPEDYIARIRSVESIADPDQERTARELAIYR
jgi:cation transport regulator ChaC